MKIKRIKIRTGIIIAFLAFSVFHSFQAYTQNIPNNIFQEKFASDIKVLDYDETDLTLTYSPQWVKLSYSDSLFDAKIPMRLVNGDYELIMPGAPVIPKRVFPVWLKSSRVPSIQVLSHQTQAIAFPGVGLAPNYDFKTKSWRHAKQQKPIGKKWPMISISEPTKFRGKWLAYITIYPVQVKSGNHTAQLTKSITFKLSFHSSKHSKSIFKSQAIKTGIDEFQPTLVNQAQLELWKQSGVLESTRPKKQDLVFQQQSSVLGSGKVYKLGFKNGGFYTLTKAFFDSVGIDLSNVDPRNIQLFFNGGNELNTSLSALVQDDLREICIQVAGESDGRFDPDDKIRFYVKGPQGVSYDVPKYPPRVNPSGDTQKRLTHYLNRQSKFSYAFLKFGNEPGKRPESKSSLNDPSPHQPDSFTKMTFVENEVRNISNTGIDLFDVPLNSSRPSITTTFRLHGLATSKPIHARVKAVTTGRNETIQLKLNGQLLGSKTTGSIGASGYQKGEYFFYDVIKSNFDAISETVELELTLLPNSFSSQTYPDWMELAYQSTFNAVGDVLVFNSLVGLSSSKPVAFSIGNFSATPTIWDITNLWDIKSIAPISQTLSSANFQSLCSPDSMNEFLAFSENAVEKRPHLVEALANQNLHAIIPVPYIIIYPPSYEAAAKRLLEHRTGNASGEPLSGIAVNQDQVFNEFSGGMPDFTAIRNFVRYLYQKSATIGSAPKYVVLFGDGDWDVKNVVSPNYDRLLTYQSDEVLQPITSVTCTDDFFVAIDGDIVPTKMIPDLAIGRLTAQTPNEAERMVDKIIAYETNQAQGLWRNRVIFVADDGLNAGTSDGAQFSDDSERIVQSLPEWMHPIKLYSAFYKADFSSGSMRRPEAYQQIINQINQGALITNFIGHGNPSVWTAERIFEPASSLPLLNNTNKLTIGVTATCDFGRADDPVFRSGAEHMLLMENGGAVAMLTTTRSIFISTGSSYPPILFQEIFRENGSETIRRLGDSYTAFKVQRAGATDATKFTLLGDPALILPFGDLKADLDSIHGIANDGFRTIQMKAFDKVKLSGTIRTQNKVPLSDFSGTIVAEIYDVPQELGADHQGTGRFDRYYAVQQSLIFNGEATVANGRFDLRFIVPKSIQYDSSQNGKILLQAWPESQSGGSKTAPGATTKVIFAGTNTDVLFDDQGPTVDVYLDDFSFRSGDITGTDPLFLAKLSDENGINLASGSVNNMVLILDDNEQNPIELSSYYQSEPNSFTDGKIQYPLKNLSIGKHTLKFKVWDNFNNSTETYLYFTVESDEKLSFGEVYNFPNPFNPKKDRKTRFIVPQNRSGDDLEIKLSIYTVAGRKIYEQKQRVLNAPSRLILEWDGKDDVGSDIANGVYIYKIRVKSFTENFQKEVLEKLVIYK